MQTDKRIIEVDKGAQAIVMLPEMGGPLDYLPDEAYDDLLVVSTRGHPVDVEDSVRKSGADPSNVMVVPVSGSSIQYDGPMKVFDRVGPNDLTGVGVRFSNGLDTMGDDGWVVFDNFNIFLMYADDSRVYRFMDTVVGKVRQRGMRGVYSTVRGAIKDRTYERFRQLCDEEIDLR